ncbi:MAG: class I SAM-dependent methyltransferase [Legionella sp.]|nr:class I SAM-dependent methyltransferase [Legionella sp.]
MKQLPISPELYEYILNCSLREHPVLQKLREDTSHLELANMQTAPEQAQFLQFLLRLIRAKNVLELGTFTGYSALAMSLALPEDGRVITCDISPRWTEKAPTFWQEAEQEHKIELRLGPALESLDTLVHEGWEGKFDFVFIDADKTNYVPYYEMALRLMQARGLIAIDNVLWDGKVIDPLEIGGQTREIRRLNELLKNDKRVFISLLPIADGLTLVQKQ